MSDKSQKCCHGCGNCDWYEGAYCDDCLTRMTAAWQSPATDVARPDDEGRMSFNDLHLAPVVIPDVDPPPCPHCRDGRPCDDHYLYGDRYHAGYGSPSSAPLDDEGEFSSSWPLIVRGYEQEL
jgi:hypothetical protein